MDYYFGIPKDNYIKYLAMMLDRSPCDHSLKFTNLFCRSNGLTVTTVDIRKTLPGMCDCSILYGLKLKNMPTHKGMIVNYDLMRLEWVPKSLEANVFEVLGEIREWFQLKLVGEPYELDSEDGTFAQNFERKR